MAFMHCRLHSQLLKKEVEVNVVYPTGNGTPDKVVYLLHGLAGDASVWCRRTPVERYACDRNFAVIMPDGGRGFYTDAVRGAKYWSYVADELPKQMHAIFKLPGDRKDTFAAGLSMGGYGALKLGLRRPERFAAVGAMSSSADIERRLRHPDNDAWRTEMRLVFGGASRIAADGNDLFALAANAVKSGEKLPKIISFCGTEDRLLQDNRRFGAHLGRLGYPEFHAYERPGAHTWEFWNEHIVEIFDFFASGKLPE
jgi:S-formylglutathione hydrolase FrmB